MPENTLVDLNVIIDVLLKRERFEASLAVLTLGESAGHQLYISAHMVTTFAYILEGAKVPSQKIKQQLMWLLQAFTVVPVDQTLFDKALESDIRDYEDAVVEQAAIACGASAIVTRNTKDFKTGSILAMTPEEYAAKV